MAVTSDPHELPRTGKNPSRPAQSRPAVADSDDYAGMPLEQWKKEVSTDMDERFGPTPHDLEPSGNAGW